ncbi:PfkB family carbohydrate kinase [Rhizobium leguminosarum]|uniref:PfkB family carbohydrate kinase n=1 Tax=Rhizobium leguminosarum TaxID=384 RepID=UPI001FDEC844|nr:PfkB family carbohydrate kinase [Rhizobium leguminosarum]
MTEGRLLRQERSRLTLWNAGDSFIAGFLSASLTRYDWETCLESGRRLAAKTCGHPGGFPQTQRIGMLEDGADR